MAVYRARIEQLSLSENGKEVRLTAKDRDGQDVQLLFPSDDLDRLLAAVAHASALAMQRRLEDPRVRKILPLETWEVRPHAENGIVVTLTLRDRIQFSFIFDDQAATLFSAAILQSSTEPRRHTEHQAKPN